MFFVIFIVCVVVAMTILCVILQSPKNYPATEDLRLQMVNSESSVMDDSIHESLFKARRSKVSSSTWSPEIGRLINRNDYSNMETNNLVSNQYGSNSYQDSYDSTNNVGSFGAFKQDYGNVIGIPGSTITNRPEFGVNYSPVYSPNNWPIENTPIIDHHKLTTHPQTPITNISASIKMTSEHQSQSSQNKIVIPIPNDILIDWRIIGIISLVKLVLVKLKIFSVIQILLFLILKLKFIMALCAFKLILLLKFMKFFKVLLPLFLLPMFLTMILSPLFFIAIFSIPERIVQLLRMPMDTPASPVTKPEPVSSPPALPPSQPNVPPPSNPAPSNPAPNPARPLETLIDPFNVLNGRPI